MDWFLLLVAGVLVLLIPTAYAGKIGAPYAPTRRASIRKTFEQLQIDADDVVVDLGAGDGSVVIEAARKGAQAYGYELSPIMFCIAWSRSLFQERARIRFGNFYKQSISDATVVFVFLLPQNMPRLKAYLATQSIPAGRYCIAYAFPFQDMPALTTIREKRVLPMYVYDLQELTNSGAKTGKS
ncbi:MAG: hypothetical protein WD200_01960 [Candidatus Andersenbacteria bacterium]